MQTSARLLLTFAAVFSAIAWCTPAQAKRYIVRRDPTTGQITLVDPDETLFSKIAKPVVQPVLGVARGVKNTVFGGQTPLKPGQVPGFTGRAITQRDMERPPHSLLDYGIHDTLKTANTATQAVGLGSPVGDMATTLHNQYQEVVGSPVQLPSSPISSQAGQTSSASDPAAAASGAQGSGSRITGGSSTGQSPAAGSQ